jgi:carbamoyl-phosphate synthase large subunit
MGGQTALNTALALFKDGTLEKYGVQMIGADAEAIEKGGGPAQVPRRDEQDRAGEPALGDRAQS